MISYKDTSDMPGDEHVEAFLHRYAVDPSSQPDNFPEGIQMHHLLKVFTSQVLDWVI